METIAIRVSVLLGSLLWSAVVSAAPSCPEIEQFLLGKAVGVVCFHSSDLRTNNPQTTPANNSITTFADGTPLPDCWRVPTASRPSPTGASFPTGRRPRQRRCRESRSVVGSLMIRPRKRDSYSAFPTTGTASWLWRARPARAANTTATGRGAITFCPWDMRTRRRTRACSTCTWYRSPLRHNRQAIRCRAG